MRRPAQGAWPTEALGDAFDGIPSDGLAFLRELAGEQNRDWFAANKHRYEAALQRPLAALVVALSSALAERDIPLRGDPARSLFRINRDIRFSRDKSPYKTNAGLVLSREGGKGSPGLLYLHVDPAGCFAAAGFYRPEPSHLGALRDAVLARPAAFAAAEASLAEAGLALGDGDPLSRLPRGFEAVTDPAVARVLKMRSLVVTHPLEAEALGDRALVTTLAEFGEAALPLLRFGWSALDGSARQL